MDVSKLDRNGMVGFKKGFNMRYGLRIINWSYANPGKTAIEASLWDDKISGNILQALLHDFPGMEIRLKWQSADIRRICLVLPVKRPEGVGKAVLINGWPCVRISDGSGNMTPTMANIGEACGIVQDRDSVVKHVALGRLWGYSGCEGAFDYRLAKEGVVVEAGQEDTLSFVNELRVVGIVPDSVEAVEGNENENEIIIGLEDEQD